MRRPASVGRTGRAAVVLAMLLLIAAVPTAAPDVNAQGLSDRIASARHRQAELQRALERQRQVLGALQGDETIARTALASTDQSLDGINADQGAVRREIADATDALAKVQARRDTLVDQLRQLDWTLALLEQEIADGDQELEARRRLLGVRLAEAYRSQNTSLLEQVLADQSFSDVLSEASAYLAYGDQDAQLAQDIAADQRALDTLRALTSSTRYRTDRLRRDTHAAEEELRAQQDRLERAREKLAKLEAQTNAIHDQQKAAFHRIASSQKKARALIEARAAAEDKLDRKIAALVAEAQRRAEAREAAQSSGSGGALKEGSGRFDWPTSGVVSQEYGCTGFSWEPPMGNCAHFHDGIDIVNGEGTPIRSAENGVVAFVGWNPYEGSDPAFLVIIGHSGGYETLYGHLQPRFAVRAGQSVNRGQLIGYMGNTGHSTGTHLHWEVEHNGVNVNPRDVV